MLTVYSISVIILPSEDFRFLLNSLLKPKIKVESQNKRRVCREEIIARITNSSYYAFCIRRMRRQGKTG
jgi:hypothetical protein